MNFSSFSFQQRVFFGYLFILVVFCVVVGYIVNRQTEGAILTQKEHYLIGFAVLLDVRLEPGGYDAILRRHNAEDASRDEKIRILNSELALLTDEVAGSLQSMGVGYYSLDLDAILTYGPSSQYAHAVGRPISEGHPGRKVMATNTPEVSFGTMVRGNIMNAMHPISRGGRVIGYAWANELTSDVKILLDELTFSIATTLLLCATTSICFFVFMMHHAVSAVGRLIKGVRTMREDFSHRLPPLAGEMKDVAISINDMADEVSRSADMLRNVMANVDAIVYVCDAKTYELLYTNDYLARLLGKTDFSGTCYRILMNFDTPCPFCPMNRLFDALGNPLDTLEEKERHHEIFHRDYFMRSRIIHWHDNRLAQMTVGTDITQHKALELAKATNLAQKSFLARMSHELRTPMNGVLGMAHLALQADPPPRQLAYLKKIQSSASLLLGIINDILDFSRIEAGRMEVEYRVFNLHTALQNIHELILPRMKNREVELDFRMEDSVPQFVKGDELRLSQVLLNLLGNAAKFTAGGSITLAVSAQCLPGEKIRLECAVRDSGIGMSAEQLSLLFQPFSQADVSTSRKFGGTGLGLAISKALVELMGGEITVTSEPGKGSVFSFFIALEVVTDTADIAGEADVSDAPQRRCDGCNFLLVEDNVINQEIAMELLTSLGGNVDIAENGKEAVLAFLGRDYDLIFMDVRMPVMDGLEAARRIRASGKHDAAAVPIVAMTANAMREDQEESLKAGMNRHLAKPIDVQTMNDIIFSLLEDSSKE